MKKDKSEDDYSTSLSAYIETLAQQNYISTTWAIKNILGISEVDIEMNKKMEIARERFDLLDGK
jgi:hypothetical protein